MIDNGNPVKFFIHGGRHTEKIREAGLNLQILEPQITEEQDRILMDIDQHRAPIGTPLPFSEEQLKGMVESNISAIKEFNPYAVFCGLDLGAFITIQYLKLPMT